MGGGLNTYGYVSGNPLKFSDALGLVQYDSQLGIAYSEFAPDIWFDPEFGNALSYIESIPTGQNLLTQLADQYASFQVFTADACRAERDPSTGNIEINPNFNPGLHTENGIQRPALHVILLHELAHALVGNNGKPRRNGPSYDKRYANWEMNFIVNPWENSAREEFGLPNRTKYESNVPPTCKCGG